jgi:hypothetical protein
MQAKVLTDDQARQIAVNIARLPGLFKQRKSMPNKEAFTGVSSGPGPTGPRTALAEVACMRFAGLSSLGIEAEGGTLPLTALQGISQRLGLMGPTGFCPKA